MAHVACVLTPRGTSVVPSNAVTVRAVWGSLVSIYRVNASSGMPNISFTDVLQFWGHLIQSNKSPPNSFSHINHIPVLFFFSICIIIMTFPVFF